MNWLDLLQAHMPDFEGIAETPILDEDKKLIGWHSVLNGGGLKAYAGGTSQHREAARRICLAETLERMSVDLLYKEGVAGLELESVPSTSGFACGFDLVPTQFRSLCEGLERWIWSKWVDDRFRIPEVSLSGVKLTRLATHFAKTFDNYKAFQIDLPAVQFNDEPILLRAGIILGFKDQGVFPGSRVTSVKDDLWEHALIESFRHFKIFENVMSGRLKDSRQSWYLDRVKYFGENASAVDEVIHKATGEPLPTPKIKLHRQIDPPLNAPYFLFRTLCEDFVPWHLGDRSRFVY